MKVPSAVARSLLSYIQAGGAEVKRARVMLQAMGWLPNGERATQEEIDQAHKEWAGSEQQEIPF